jgi:hypothetical protein
MATAFSASARGSRNEGDSAGSWTRWAVVAGLVVLLALAGAWLLGWIRFATDPRVLEIRKLQEAARAKFVATGGPSTLAEATEAVVAMGQIREKVQALPPSLREEAERSGGGMFRSAMTARINAYFQLPPEKRAAELDRQIRQEEMMRKAFDAAGAVAGVFGGGPGGQGGGGPPSGGPPRNGSEDDRNRWRKDMIDRTTPSQRARYVEYRRVMDERRTQLGLPPRGPR